MQFVLEMFLNCLLVTGFCNLYEAYVATLRLSVVLVASMAS